MRNSKRVKILWWFERKGTVRKRGLYDKEHTINIDEYAEDDVFIARPRSHPISKLYLTNKNDIDSTNQRPHRKYNIRFAKKYLKFFHTSIYQAEIMYLQFRTIYYRMNIIFLEIESRIRIKNTKVKLSARLVSKIIKFSDNTYDSVFKQLLKNDRIIIGRIDNISDSYQKR